MLPLVPAYIDPSPIMTAGGGALAAVLAVLTLGLGVLAAFFRRAREGFRRHWAKLLLAGVAGAAALAAAWHWSRPRDGRTNMTGARIIVLGLDGLSPEIVEPMLAAGELPNFRRLKEQGGYARLATTNPAQSPVAWSTFATGLNPGRHGVFDFIRRDPATYLPEVGTAKFAGGRWLGVRQGKAFWDYCTERRVPCTILHAPLTFPPDRIAGRLLSGMGVPDLLGTQGTFSFYTTAPVAGGQDVGGEVFAVERAPALTLALLGPNRRTLLGQTERTRVEFTVRPGPAAAQVELQGQAFTLAPGDWSAWQRVRFALGPRQETGGMVRFLLVELEPHFKLYVSPISLDPRDPAFPISHPPEYSRELAAALGDYATRGMPFDTWALNEGRLGDAAFVAHAEQLLDENLRLTEFELARCARGVLFSYVEYPDVMQHVFWRAHDPPPAAGDAGSDPIPGVYRKLDAFLGRVLATLRPGDVLLVLSDHGFGAFRRAVHLNSWLRDNGYLVLQDGQTVGADLLRNVDWRRTRAYALGFGGIYLNLAGREGQGLVAPAAAVALKAEIAGKLRTWQDPATGQPLVHAVYRNEDILHGPAAALAPDLYVGFARGYRASWQTALGAAPAVLVEDNLKQWSGDHLFDPALVPGVLFSSRPLKKTDPGLADLAPTILRLAGFSDADLHAAGLEGKPLF